MDDARASVSSDGVVVNGGARRRAGDETKRDLRIIHNMQPTMRETVLRRLCSKDEPWSVIFESNDPNLTPHVDRRIILD